MYLTGCAVGGRSIDYTYGEDKMPVTYAAYEIGDTVTYNNMDFYVIKNSGTDESSVTLLKAEPLSYEEIEEYSAGTGASVSNRYGYGGMQYHSESNLYATSYVKTTVEAWAEDNVTSGLVEVRLISYDDLIDNLGYDPTIASVGNPKRNENVPSWVYSYGTIHGGYWTMSAKDGTPDAWNVNNDGNLVNRSVNDHYFGCIRPVITISKSAL